MDIFLYVLQMEILFLDQEVVLLMQRGFQQCCITLKYALKYFITKLFYGTDIVQNYHMLASVHISIGKQ